VQRIMLLTLCLILNLGVLEAGDFSLSRITNEISFYKNTNDQFDQLGQTLQIVSINSLKTFTWFNLEFTGDFNWDMVEGQNYDYYIEFGLVKNITSKLSVNYQRIYGTFVSEPVNQFGLRLSL